MEVEILDGIMGAGKTTGMIRWMVANHQTQKFIYVSPLLSEVEKGGRIDLATENTPLKFTFPTTEDNDTKSEHLLELLTQGLNIACTHSLYLNMTDKHFDEISNKGYTVIIDEEIGVIEGYQDFSESDLDFMLNMGCIGKQETDGMLLWIKDEPSIDERTNKYYRFKRHIQNGLVYSTKRSKQMMVTQLPIKLITSAKRVVIMTYMFEGNILSAFLKLKGIKYKPFTEVELNHPSKEQLRSLINIVQPKDKKYEAIEKMTLSNTWWETKATQQDVGLISKYISLCARRCGATAKDVLYTFPKNRKYGTISKKAHKVKPANLISEKDGNVVWLASSTRATNKYAHKWCLIHCYNRYPNQQVNSYFQDYGQTVDSDVFATSEMLQWIWRSRIRNNQEIHIAIASKRMKKLFLDWLYTAQL